MGWVRVRVRVGVRVRVRVKHTLQTDIEMSDY